MIENFIDTTKDRGGNYDRMLNSFYEHDSLELDTNKIIDSVDKIRNGKNTKNINDFIINNDLILSSNESGNVSLACKKNEEDDNIFISKENDLENINVDNVLKIGSFISSKNFYHKNVILPTETVIQKESDKLYRFYEAGDTDLEKYINSKKTLPVKKSLSILIRVCDGVESLHEIGIVNIDLAPLNIIITKDDVKITDIDSANIDNNEDGKIIANSFMKNRFLSAPELFTPGNTVDKTVDIYAASCILYRLIYGDWPYNIEEYCQDHNINAEIKQKFYEFLHKQGYVNFNKNSDIELKKIITKGMNANPKERYQSMKELIFDLLNLYDKQK